MPESDDRHRLARLRWRSRRGMRELDALLMRYLDEDFPAVEGAEQDAFERLLSWPDPLICDLLAGRVAADDEHLARVVQRLLRAHRH